MCLMSEIMGQHENMQHCKLLLATKHTGTIIQDAWSKNIETPTFSLHSFPVLSVYYIKA